MDQLSQYFSPTAPDDARQDDFCIYIYVAHLQLSDADLSSLIDRIFMELDICYLSADVSIIIADDFNGDGVTDTRVNLLRSSHAAQAFRLRCHELEFSPRDIVV